MYYLQTFLIQANTDSTDWQTVVGCVRGTSRMHLNCLIERKLNRHHCMNNSHVTDWNQKFSCSSAIVSQWQHFNATYHNIVGGSMLRAFGHPVATCCNILAVVGSSMKMVKFSTVTFTDAVLFWPGLCNDVALSRACTLVPFTTPNMSQQGGQTRATVFLSFCHENAPS